MRKARDKHDLLRFDASGAVSGNMFDEDWPRFVVKMATGAGKTKVLSLLMTWSFFHKLYEPDSTLARNFLLIAPNIIILDRLELRAYDTEYADMRAADARCLAALALCDFVRASGVTTIGFKPVRDAMRNYPLSRLH